MKLFAVMSLDIFFGGIRLVFPINDALYSPRRGEDLLSIHFLEEIKYSFSK